MTTLAAARTVTQIRLSPTPAPVPAAEDCTEDELLELAARGMRAAWDLGYDHLQAICRLLVERVEPRARDAEANLEIARGLASVHLRAYRQELAASAQTTRLLVKELGASIELAKEVEILRAENLMLRAAVKTLGGEDGGQW